MQALTKKRPTKKKATQKVSMARAESRACIIQVGSTSYKVASAELPKIRRFIDRVGGRQFKDSVVRTATPRKAAELSSVPWREVVPMPGGEPATMLRGLRSREDLTQAELAEKIDESQPNIAAMENGKRPISRKMAEKLAQVFNVDYRLFL